MRMQLGAPDSLFWLQSRTKQHETSALLYNTRMIHKDKHTRRTDAQAKRTSLATRGVVIAVLAIACALIALGILGEAPHDVWQRAAMVCYECIGIG